ncbi:hypothetical protein M422DRAFT_74655 [Sphaerobolus stellatus SS14]|nr:hypothetical protein M422DRAFT_74655 [Sphaerobolus stellatus SS14]
MQLVNLRLHHLPSYLLLAITLFPIYGLTQEHSGPSAKRSFLNSNARTAYDVQDVLEHQPAQHAMCNKPTGPIETTMCDYESVESVSHTLHDYLGELVRAPFFKYFRTDLYRECPFWQENGFCMNRECGITTVDESEIPLAWRAAELSKVQAPSEELRSSLPGCYYRDADFCFHDDTSEGEYFDLSENPERFTGYEGPSANRVWSSIYQENCFGISEQSLHRPISERNLLGLEPKEGDDGYICEEKRVYYRIISGLHASISMHICRDSFNQSTGEWGPDLQCFIQRIASHPERLNHIYFNTVLLLRAVARLSPYLSAYDYCSTPEGVHEHDGGNVKTKALLENVMDIAKQVGKFDEKVLFRGANADVLKEEFKHHFRNVSRIMDCVGCDKCRLWGKLQVSGLATALKVLFELDEKALCPKANPDLLQRSEVVALINTLNRFIESLVYVDEFRQLWAERSGANKEALLRSAGVQPTAGSEPTTIATKSKPSPAAWPGLADLETYKFPPQLKQLLEVCRQSTAEGLQACARMIGNIFSFISSFFTPSGKEQGPRSDL